MTRQAITAAVSALCWSAAWTLQASSAPVAPQRDKSRVQQQLVAATGGDKAAGKAIFDQVCANCHKFGDAGQEIGPDLSAIAGKQTRVEIIESLLFPSKVIADQYQPVLVQTKDGDVYGGLVVKENARVLTLVTSDHPEAPVEILKSRIEARMKSTTSAMPETTLDPYSLDQIQGLIAYLLAGPGGA